jgi:hypothetical protein
MKFQTGVNIAKSVENGVKESELALLMGKSLAETRILLYIVKKFDCDEKKFIKFYKENKCQSWSGFQNKVYSRNKANKDATRTNLYRAVHSTLKQLTEQDTEQDLTQENARLLHQFGILRDLLDRYIPKKPKLIDKTELKYFNCCAQGCNAEPPEDGHTLIHSHILPSMQFPVCEKCTDTPIDYHKVARIYYVYATQLEDAYHNLINGG